VAQNGVMAKNKDSRSGDRHKPGRMVRVKETLAEQADLLCEQNATNLTQEVNRALRELLVREGLWPPPKKEQE
jgi:hypothetical protein